MFKSGILNIRKVRSESNIKLFEYFGQPSISTLESQSKSTIPNVRFSDFHMQSCVRTPKCK